MFFLGVSTHFMIYLFIPAILIIWFYFKGITGFPKEIILLPEEIECKYVIRNSVENICFYQMEEKVLEQNIVSTVDGRSPDLNKYFSITYLQPVLQNKTLRAPPILL